MDFLEILRDKAFLGREFLTWLWFKSIQSGGRVEIHGGKVLEVEFLDKMTLDLAESDTPQTVTLKGEQSELREGLAALKEGKKIEEARISIRAGDDDFTMNLKATWFSFGSFRTPAILPSSEADIDDDGEAAFLEKTRLIEEGLEALDGLFGHYLRLRVSDRWEEEELPALRRWIASSV